jgi:hypothetical protein
MKALILALAFLAPDWASAGVTRHKPVTESARYVHFQWQGSTAATGTVINHVYPYPGGARLVDVIVHQNSVGVGGTSVAVDVKNVSAVTLLTTPLALTLASGANTVTDARGNLALPSGWTRPVIKTDATATVAEGARIQIATTETGTYSSHPVVVVTLVFEPLY